MRLNTPLPNAHQPCGEAAEYVTPWGELVAGKVSAAQTAGAFSAWELVALPGWERDLYVHHAVDECFYVADGHFDIRLDDPDRIVRASSGDLVYVPRGVARSLRNSANRAGRLLIVQTPGRLGSPRSRSGIEFCGDPENTTSGRGTAQKLAGESSRTDIIHHQEREKACEQ